MKKLVVALFVVFLACGTAEQDIAETISDNSNGNGNDGDNQIPHYLITAVDTIGVELGDSNYVFGSIETALFGSNGEVLVLDGLAKQISVFASDGEFLTHIGRQGSAPGEFQRPMAMAFLGNGQLAVSDTWGGKMILFDSNYAYSGEITGFFPAPPMAISGADGSAFVGLMKKFDIENDLVGYSLGRLDEVAEPTVVYAEEMMDFLPTMIGPGYTETTVAFASDLSGKVFTSVMSTDEYIVSGYSPDGELFVTIEQPYTPVPKTMLEIEEEIEDFNAFLENRQSSGGGGRMQSMGVQIPLDELVLEPNPNHYAVSELMVDSEERVWVRRGAETQPFFDVFDYSGNLLFTASIEEGDPDSADWEIVVGENNLLGYSSDPLGYPKVVVLHME